MTTPELAEVATKAEAEARAEAIRGCITSYATGLQLVAEATKRRDWIALGYPNWDAWIAGEFGPDRVKAGMVERAYWVNMLRDYYGMSTRAIANATGVTEGTVRNDLKKSGAQNYAPDTPERGDEEEAESLTKSSEAPVVVQGRDGKQYHPPAKKPKPEPEPELPADLGEILDDEVGAFAPTSTGDEPPTVEIDKILDTTTPKRPPNPLAVQVPRSMREHLRSYSAYDRPEVLIKVFGPVEAMQAARGIIAHLSTDENEGVELERVRVEALLRALSGEDRQFLSDALLGAQTRLGEQAQRRTEEAEQAHREWQDAELRALDPARTRREMHDFLNGH